MNKSRSFSHLIHRLSGKPKRGRAVRDKHGQSARQRAFDYFQQGLRPSQLPDLGVAKTSIYRYYQSWKHRDKELGFRLAKRAIAADQDLKEALVQHLGVTEDELTAALRRSRTAAQLKVKLGQPENKKVERLIGRVWRLTFEAIIGELGKCRILEERLSMIQATSRRLGLTEAQLISQLVEMNNKLRTDALLRKVIRTTPDRHTGARAPRSQDQG